MSFFFCLLLLILKYISLLSPKYETQHTWSQHKRADYEVMKLVCHRNFYDNYSFSIFGI